MVYLLERFTDTPIKGFIFGSVVTMVLQSSTAITILTIGLVNARILSFYRAVGIILGANVGTTFTTQLIAFDFKNLLIPLIRGIFLSERVKLILLLVYDKKHENFLSNRKTV